MINYLIELLAVTIQVILEIIIDIMFNPLRRSKKAIGRRMLRIMPVGTSFEGASKIIIIVSKKKWRSMPAIEENSLLVYIGKYGVVFQHNVTITIYFDKNLVLSKINVSKDPRVQEPRVQ